MGYVALCKHGVPIAGTHGPAKCETVPEQVKEDLEWGLFIRGCLDRGFTVKRSEKAELHWCDECCNAESEGFGMTERGTSGETEITPTDLLASVKTSFEIATSALVQAKINLGLLGFDRTKNEAASMIEDLRKATRQLADNAKNEVSE